MSKILVISGHTDLDSSIANKTILETLAQRLPGAEIVKLDELYPDFRIDAAVEQQRLLQADVVVLQFPIFWYSAPSLLERWMEESFTHGFSHGHSGDKLKGKKLVLSFTTGAPEAMYVHDGPIGHTIDEYLPCYQSMCRLTQMEYCGYIHTGGVSYANRTTPALIGEQRAAVVEHAERLVRLLKTIDPLAVHPSSVSLPGREETPTH